MIDPRLWGPATWDAIHYIAAGYPAVPSPDVAARYRAFYTAIGYVLPCTCAANYRRHMEEIPIDPFLERGGMEEGSLFDWTVRMHGLVNIEQGRRPWTLERAVKRYTPPQPPSPSPYADRDNYDVERRILTLFSVIVAVSLLVASIVWVIRSAGRRVSRLDR